MHAISPIYTGLAHDLAETGALEIHIQLAEETGMTLVGFLWLSLAMRQLYPQINLKALPEKPL